MTDEAQGQSHDETPTPPASTRWSEEPVQDDEGLAPPFVPGRSVGRSSSAPAPDVAPAAAEPPRQGEPDAQERTAAEPDAPADDEPFPFEATFGGENEAEAPEDDFPFDQFDIEGEGGEGEDAPRAEAAPADGGWSPVSHVEWEPEPAGEPADAASDGTEAGAIPEAELVPLDAEPEPVVDVEPEPAHEAEPAYEAEPVGAAVDGEVEEVARLLERLSRLLREEGAEAVRREMDSSDRLTALLAGLVAGYLSGRS